MFYKKIFIFFSLFTLAISNHTALAKEFTFKHTVSFLSEYYARGLSQSNEQPAPQYLGYAFHNSGIYAGTFITRVEFNDNDEADAEWDFTLGFQDSFDKLNYRTGLIYFTYPNSKSALQYNFWELDLGLGYNFEKFYTELSLRVSPDYFASSGLSRYAKLEVQAPINQKLLFKSHIAHRYIEENDTFYNIPDNYDWEIGAEYKIFQNTDLITKYVDSSFTKSECLGGTKLCNERLITGIKYSF